MGFISRFSLQRRQSDAAAADQRIAGTVHDISADGADIEFAAQHIGGGVLVDDVLSIHQLNDRNPQSLRQRLQQGNVRQTLGSFPLGDGLAADADSLGQLRLGQFSAFPKLLDGCSGDVSIHLHRFLSGTAYHETVTGTTCVS